MPHRKLKPFESSTEVLNKIFKCCILNSLMFKVLDVRMVERAVIYLTTTTVPVRQAIMVGLAKVRHPLITLTLYTNIISR